MLPINQNERFYTDVVNGENPAPATREEKFYKYLIENASGGSGGGAFVITKSNGALDKTYAEIKSAIDSGVLVMLHYVEYGADKVKYLISASGSEDSYMVEFTHGEEEGISSYIYAATSENGTLEPFNP